MRILPTVVNNKSGGATKSFILWYYTQYYGYKPDATVYRRHLDRKNPSALIHIFEPATDDMAEQSPTDAAELIYYLEDAGVDVDGPTIILYPGLLSAYVNRKKSERAKKALEDALDYLRSVKGEDSKFNAPEGW